MNKITELKGKGSAKAVITGVWKGEQEILQAALGESLTSVPADLNMHVRIGGITETYLGTLLMILAKEGKISLNDKISKWLPDLLEAEKVTPGMLIKNTAGYKDYVLNKDFVNDFIKDPFRQFTREEIIAYSTSEGELNYSPGTSQRYSHTEFTILGWVLERATGKTMQVLYDEYIFRPLGLQNTGYSINSELPFPVLHAYSSDRGIYEDVTYWNPSWTIDSGPIYSTLPELGIWARTFGSGKLLTPAYYDSLISRPPGAGNPEQYFASGFGVVNGWYIQNPSFNGYSGAFGYLPSEKITIIVFTTQTENPVSDKQAINLLKEISKIITPGSPVNF